MESNQQKLEKTKLVEYIINDKCITYQSDINDYFINTGENISKQIMSTDSSYVNYIPHEADSKFIF